MPANNLSIRILTVDDISLIKELCEIDKICFGDIGDKDQGSTDYWNDINQQAKWLLYKENVYNNLDQGWR